MTTIITSGVRGGGPPMDPMPLIGRITAPLPGERLGIRLACGGTGRSYRTTIIAAEAAVAPVGIGMMSCGPGTEKGPTRACMPS